MKVFLSWSGERSRLVATLLDEWLRCVLQAIRPWISTKDIDRGALWFNEIQDQLQDTTTGIICLTQENKERPWILFEAGALAKGLSNSRVCTLLIDLRPSDIKDPLAQLNHTLPDRDNMFELVRTLNNRLANNALDPRILETVFNTYWGQFEQRFMEILNRTSTPAVAEPRSEQDLLSEILEVTRSLSNRINHLESRQLTQGGGFYIGTPRSPQDEERKRMVDRCITLYIEGNDVDEISSILKIPVEDVVSIINKQKNILNKNSALNQNTLLY
ncbi:toll/interleukin-1 receptor domain-containing protein [Aeromonas veronii]|uniref:toll/interleukin-1 receptor domain-containing protein n=1 Tax=Aeromonas TaxID=642 RepID=UPI00185F3D7C|nr:toll/interleukin-1 receptor domain-containing protein [Aeromonas veronii]QNF13666.1 toll/interleukin-1 receptor domain-containing protein [Aeromonas jandaei]UZE61634.1 toll/interleukin-1 receptor domain-containing protein [Aeromonas veronii]